VLYVSNVGRAAHELAAHPIAGAKVAPRNRQVNVRSAVLHYDRTTTAESASLSRR